MNHWVYCTKPQDDTLFTLFFIEKSKQSKDKEQQESPAEKTLLLVP